MQIRIVALLMMAAAVAHARDREREREPIVLVNADPAFASALEDALLPAGMEIVALGTRAAPSTAELTARSRELADQQQATATVWLMPAPGGATLVAYDRTVDRLLVRELPYELPLSAPQAAEAARMVRTMLRALRVSTDSDAAPPMVIVPPGPPPPMFAAGLGLGAWFAAPGTDRALAASLSLAWRPEGLGVAATGTIAPAARVTSPTFVGRVRDIVVAAEVRNALALPPVRITPSAGMALHAVTLTGSFGASELTSRRYNPALRAGVTAGYDLARGVEIGLAVSVDCLLQRQKYEAASEEILVIPRLQVVTGVVVGLKL